MKSLKTLLFLAVIAVISSCSPANSQKEVKQVGDVKITRAVVSGNTAKCTAKISVAGMSCAKACGGTISKCLKNIDGIKSAEIYFDPERKASDFATIEFDDKVVTEKEMIAAIEKLNDGQYKVKSIEIVVSEVSYEKINKGEKKEEKAAGKVTAFNNIHISIPSIFEVLTMVVE